MVFFANIKWVSSQSGGRKMPPKQGTRYCPLIRLEDKGNAMDWSIDCICPDFNNTDKIIFKFLVDNAPENLIIVGNQYDLFEGNRMVAKISILERVCVGVQ